MSPGPRPGRPEGDTVRPSSADGVRWCCSLRSSWRSSWWWRSPREPPRHRRVTRHLRQPAHQRRHRAPRLHRSHRVPARTGDGRLQRALRHSRPALSLGSSPPHFRGRRSSPSGPGSAFSAACPHRETRSTACPGSTRPAGASHRRARSPMWSTTVRARRSARLRTSSVAVRPTPSPPCSPSAPPPRPGQARWPANCHGPARTSPPQPSDAPSTSWAATTAPPTIPRS